MHAVRARTERRTGPEVLKPGRMALESLSRVGRAVASRYVEDVWMPDMAGQRTHGGRTARRRMEETWYERAVHASRYHERDACGEKERGPREESCARSFRRYGRARDVALTHRFTTESRSQAAHVLQCRHAGHSRRTRNDYAQHGRRDARGREGSGQGRLGRGTRILANFFLHFLVEHVAYCTFMHPYKQNLQPLIQNAPPKRLLRARLAPPLLLPPRAHSSRASL
jgi:hypothetical protein